MKKEMLKVLLNSVLGAIASMITIYLGGQATDAVITGSAAAGAMAYLSA